MPQIINMLLGRERIALGTEYALLEALESGGFEARLDVLPAPLLPSTGRPISTADSGAARDQRKEAKPTAGLKHA
ncbi:hypothetical protein LJR071_001597 [Pseudomonas sp. LjRoot71]|uniref:hypothetical protein n=1 Tax=unclassified Pseudomonas TaxID=196821 RepID=UPI0025E8BC29|nr:hypothetical protein [Pseudomonas sp. UBA7530]